MLAEMAAERREVQIRAAQGDPRARQWLRIDDRKLFRERAWMRRVSGLFGDLEDEILDNLGKHTGAGFSAVRTNGHVQLADDPIPPSTQQVLFWDPTAFDEAWTEAMTALGEKDMESGAKGVFEEVDLKVPFDTARPEVQDFLSTWTAQHVKAIEATTADQLRGVIEQAVERGATVQALEKDIRELMSWQRSTRSMLIARTEVAGIYSRGAEIGMSDAGIETKEWLTARDTSVRPNHAAADGQEVPIGADFHVGTATGQGPGQMSEVGENAHCRCAHIPGSR